MVQLQNVPKGEIPPAPKIRQRRARQGPPGAAKRRRQAKTQTSLDKCGAGRDFVESGTRTGKWISGYQRRDGVVVRAHMRRPHGIARYCRNKRQVYKKGGKRKRGRDDIGGNIQRKNQVVAGE